MIAITAKVIPARSKIIEYLYREDDHSSPKDLDSTTETGGEWDDDPSEPEGLKIPAKCLLVTEADFDNVYNSPDVYPIPFNPKTMRQVADDEEIDWNDH
ncbi:xerD [Acrasis kona]|uniref:XerD n=1 Tax=Acrasis kona TaxID=1008807 RepID=A0AAW2Z4Y4_9EUKA